MAAHEFIGREVELANLRDFFENSRARSRITVIYGRRSIGKTRLVKEAYKGARLLHFEGLEGASSSGQRKHFRNTLYRHTKQEAHRVASSRDWADLLILLLEHVQKEPCVLFFDEIQWMLLAETSRRVETRRATNPPTRGSRSGDCVKHR